MPITEAINSYARYLAQSDKTDPSKIPAKIHLEDLGTIEYSMAIRDVFGGKTHPVVPTDSERTFYYVRAPQSRASHPPVYPNLMTRSAAAACLLAACLGSAMLTAAMFVPSLAISVPLVILGAVILFVAVARVAGHREHEAAAA